VAKIYTRTGDDGTTGMVGGGRVAKDSPLVEACGELDELNALIGVVRSGEFPARADLILELVQNNLFAIGSEIMTPDGTAIKNGGFREEEIRNLEREIDALDQDLEPLRHFILPGGAKAAADLHLVRAVVRRVERRFVALSRIRTITPQVLCYLNRLSDLCFVLARYINRQKGVPEPQLSKAGS